MRPDDYTTWIRVICESMSWNDSLTAVMNTNDFVDNFVNGLRSMTVKRLKRTCEGIKRRLNVLRGTNPIDDLDILIALIISKLKRHKNLDLGHIRHDEYRDDGGSACGIYKFGNLIVDAEPRPKTLSPLQIRALLKAFKDYYHGVESQLDAILKYAENGMQNFVEGEVNKDLARLNEYFRWWDFVGESVIVKDNQLNHVGNDPGVARYKKDCVKFITFLMGFKNDLSDECISNVYVGAGGEVSTISSMIKADAVDRKFIDTAICHYHLKPTGNNTTRCHVPEKGTAVDLNHPLTGLPLTIVFPVWKIDIITKLDSLRGFTL